MISSKEELQFYLAADKFSLKKTYKRPRIFFDEIWRYQILLRRSEYFENTQQTFLNKLLGKYFNLRKYLLGLKLGFDIPNNVFAAGLRINHFGNIVINGRAKIGMWCDIHQGVNIGSNNRPHDQTYQSLVPVIGNNVWIGPGAKLFGEITIADNTVIGANAVVNKSHPRDVTLAGMPAKVVKNVGTSALHVSASVVHMHRFFMENPQYAQFDPAAE